YMYFFILIHFIFILTLPRIFTLFTYTTLFRSKGGFIHSKVKGIIFTLLLILIIFSVLGFLVFGNVIVNSLQRILNITFDKYILGDRKSTRLNSSYVSISYAVFFLKKKKY